MIKPAATQLFPGEPTPDSTSRRRFRALARSAPWLSTSLRLQFTVPPAYAKARQGLSGSLDVILRGREAIAVPNGHDQLVYQSETFTTDRGRDYVAATTSSWSLPASLTSPVFTDDHLILRRPDIAGYGDLLPLDYLATILDPFELAGTEPASLELAFDHPTFIHELSRTRYNERPVTAAVLSAGYSYQPAQPDFVLVPPQTHTLVMLDEATGICVHRRVLENSGAYPDIDVRILAQNEYYIDSLFTSPAPTLTDVRAPIPWELRGEANKD